MGKKKDQELDFPQARADEENLTLASKGWVTHDPAVDLLGDIRDDVGGDSGS